MKPSDVIPALADPAPYFLCEAAPTGSDPRRFRVPLVHRPLPSFSYKTSDTKAGFAELERLPDIPSGRQLRALLSNAEGIGLFASKRLYSELGTGEWRPVDIQAAAGALLLSPPGEWAELRKRMRDALSIWYTKPEDAFEGVPYGLDDVQPFAFPNFSPDMWYVVLRGPMAGRVFWWYYTGENEMSTAWAEDIKDWGKKVFVGFPDSLRAGAGYYADDSIDEAPVDCQLIPLEYLPDVHPWS